MVNFSLSLFFCYNVERADLAEADFTQANLKNTNIDKANTILAKNLVP